MKKIFFCLLVFCSILFASCGLEKEMFAFGLGKEYTITDFLHDYADGKEFSSGKVVTDFNIPAQTVRATSLMKSSDWNNIKNKIQNDNRNAMDVFLSEALQKIDVKGFAKSYILSYTVKRKDSMERAYDVIVVKGGEYVDLCTLARGPNRQLSFYSDNGRTFVCEGTVVKEALYNSSRKISLSPALLAFEETYKPSFLLNKILTEQAYESCQVSKKTKTDLPYSLQSTSSFGHAVYEKNGQKVIMKKNGSSQSGYEIYDAKSANKIYSGPLPIIFILK